MDVSEADKALCLALVYAHVRDGSEYSSWVPAYTVIRRCKPSKSGLVERHRWPAAGEMMSVCVGGHYRRKALYRRLLSALRRTCKFEDMSKGALTAPPLDTTRVRLDETGAVIPRHQRQLGFV